jgi:hypothetical protein
MWKGILVQDTSHDYARLFSLEGGMKVSKGPTVALRLELLILGKGWKFPLQASFSMD